MNEFKNVFRSLREQKKLTRKELSEFTKASHDQIYNWETGRGEPDASTLSRLAEFFGVTTDYLLGRVASPADELVPITTEPLDPSIERIGYTDPSPAAQKIASALESDPALLAFWNELSQRPDLQLLFRQTKSMTPETIRKVMRIIKAIEEEEANEG